MLTEFVCCSLSAFFWEMGMVDGVGMRGVLKSTTSTTCLLSGVRSMKFDFNLLNIFVVLGVFTDSLLLPFIILRSVRIGLSLTYVLIDSLHTLSTDVIEFNDAFGSTEFLLDLNFVIGLPTKLNRRFSVCVIDPVRRSFDFLDELNDGAIESMEILSKLSRFRLSTSRCSLPSEFSSSILSKPSPNKETVSSGLHFNIGDSSFGSINSFVSFKCSTIPSGAGELCVIFGFVSTLGLSQMFSFLICVSVGISFTTLSLGECEGIVGVVGDDV